MKGNQLQKFPITVSAIYRYDVIYGLQVAIIKGKSARKRPGHVEKKPRIPLPLPIENNYKSIIILMDSIFINVQLYLLTKSAKTNFHSIKAWTGWGKVELNKGLGIVKQT